MFAVEVVVAVAVVGGLAVVVGVVIGVVIGVVVAVGVVVLVVVDIAVGVFHKMIRPHLPVLMIQWIRHWPAYSDSYRKEEHWPPQKAAFERSAGRLYNRLDDEFVGFVRVI